MYLLSYKENYGYPTYKISNSYHRIALLIKYLPYLLKLLILFNKAIYYKNHFETLQAKSNQGSNFSFTLS